MKSSQTLMTREELDGRLNCFGEFNGSDTICLKACALSINCAIAKSKFLGFQLLDDAGSLFGNSDSFRVE